MSMRMAWGLGWLAVLAWGCSSSSSTVDRNGGSTGPICGDADGDGYCINIGGSQKDVDCDDSDAERHPGAAEVCNSKDDDCDGTIDNDVTAACQLTCTEPEGGCETLTAIVAGARHVCALSGAGNVYCWGSNSYGGLGSPQLSNSTLPIAVPGVSRQTALIGSAGTSTCALTDAAATCWGAGSAMPFQILLPDTVKQVAVSDTIIHVLLDNGEVHYRYLLPDSTQSYSFQKLTAEPQVEIAAAGGRFCALAANGTLFCPADDETGWREELAVNGAESLSVTLDETVCYTKAGELHCVDSDARDEIIAGNGSAVGVVKSETYACAFNASGKTACWSPAGPKTITDAQQLAVGLMFGCVLRSNGKVSCWGNGDSGTLGDGGVGNVNTAEPTHILPGPELKLEGKVLLTTPKLGACDTLSDVALITHAGGTGPIHSSFKACAKDCENTLDVNACYASCLKNPGLSDACFACFGDLAACTGPSCYASFNACAGFPVDFLATIFNQPRFDCHGAECLVGDQVGRDCKFGKDCLSGACSKLPQFQDHTVCVSSDGGSCFGGTGSCDCSYGYCGFCPQGRVSIGGACLRECTGTDYCDVGQRCSYLSNSTRKYCE